MVSIKSHCGVLLGNFNLDVDVMVSKAVAADASDTFARQTDPLVGLDSCRDLSRTMTRSLNIAAGGTFAEK